jgi:hypothetical protein
VIFCKPSALPNEPKRSQNLPMPKQGAAFMPRVDRLVSSQQMGSAFKVAMMLPSELVCRPALRLSMIKDQQHDRHDASQS